MSTALRRNLATTTKNPTTTTTQHGFVIKMESFSAFKYTNSKYSRGGLGWWVPGNGVVVAAQESGLLLSYKFV